MNANNGLMVSLSLGVVCKALVKMGNAKSTPGGREHARDTSSRPRVWGVEWKAQSDEKKKIRGS